MNACIDGSSLVILNDPTVSELAGVETLLV